MKLNKLNEHNYKYVIFLFFVFLCLLLTELYFFYIFVFSLIFSLLVALCKDGDNREVNQENKFEYVELIARWKTTFSVSASLNPFLQVRLFLSFYDRWGVE